MRLTETKGRLTKGDKCVIVVDDKDASPYTLEKDKIRIDGYFKESDVETWVDNYMEEHRV